MFLCNSNNCIVFRVDTTKVSELSPGRNKNFDAKNPTTARMYPVSRDINDSCTVVIAVVVAAAAAAAAP